MGSTRFPGKPLADICGRPMIEHVYRRSALSSRLDQLVVATPDREIAEAVRGFGGEAVMTSSAHERATDRVAEAALLLGRAELGRFDCPLPGPKGNREIFLWLAARKVDE